MTASMLSQVHAGLERAGLAEGEVLNLRRAVARSEEMVQRARTKLVELLGTDAAPFDVVAFGSLARYEMTAASDFDYLVLAYGLGNSPGQFRDALRAANELREFLAPEDGPEQIRQPGASGLFGTIVGVPDLVEVIGLERDTNHSHSRRVLLLEESVSLFQPEEHERLLGAIVDRYLEGVPSDSEKVPRFLLNDLARYWRTISVDYQAKTRPPSRYSLRYLKLLVTRKFTYASSVGPLMIGNFGDELEARKRLQSAFRSPSVLRFLQFADLAISANPDVANYFRTALRALDKFVGLLGQSEWRDAIEKECMAGDPREKPNFAKGLELVLLMQEALDGIFFSSQLSAASRKYLVF